MKTKIYKNIVCYMFLQLFLISPVFANSTPVYDSFKLLFNSGNVLSKQNLSNLTGAYGSEYVFTFENLDEVDVESHDPDKVTILSYVYKNFKNENVYHMIPYLYKTLDTNRNYFLNHWYFWYFMNEVLLTGGANYILQYSNSTASYLSNENGIITFTSSTRDFSDYDPANNNDFTIRTWGDDPVTRTPFQYTIRECKDISVCKFIIKVEGYKDTSAVGAPIFTDYIKLNKEISTCSQIPIELFPAGADKCPVIN
jgi:hypothetical protein